MNDISMSHPLDDLIEAVLSAIPVDPVFTGETATDFIRSLKEDGYVIIPASTIGGLPPELVAKALRYTARRTNLQLRTIGWTYGEIEALRAATFEVPA